MKEIIKTSAHELRQEVGFSISITGVFAAKILSIVSAQYGTMLVTDSYIARDLSKEDAKRHLSYDYLGANILALFATMGAGYLSDKIKISKILDVVNLVAILALSVQVYRIYFVDLADSVNWVFDTAFIIGQGC